MYNCPTFFLFWKCLDDMWYWTNLYRTVADNELHFFTISNLNYTVFVSLAHILIRRRYLESMKNVKIIPGEAISTQHSILVADMYIMMPRQTKQRHRKKKIKWYDLKDENKRDELKVKLSEQTERWSQEHYRPEWHEISDTIQECTKQILGESKGGTFVEKETWWWT